MSNYGCNDNPCQPTQSCQCKVRLNSDCITVSGATFSCSSIEDNLILTDVLSQLDSFICTKFNEITTFFSLVNVGAGAQVYKGISGIGAKEIRSLTKLGDLISITQNTNEIQFTIDEAELISFIQDNQKTYSVINTGVGTSIYSGSDEAGNNTIFNLKKLNSTDGSLSIIEGVEEIDMVVNLPDTEDIVIQEGVGIDVAGAGTSINPFIITNTLPDQTVSITDSGIANVTGVYPNFNIDVPASDGSETKINEGITTNINGVGTVANPYVVEIDNPQKTLVYPADFTGINYTLTSADNFYVIFIENGVDDVTITIPTGLVDKFSVGFIQKGNGDVSFLTSGTTLFNPVGLKIKGQYYNAFIEKDGATTEFYLLGNTKA